MRIIRLLLLFPLLAVCYGLCQAPPKNWTFRPAWKKYETRVRAGDGVAMMQMADEASICGCDPTNEWVDWESEALPFLEKSAAGGDSRAMFYLARILGNHDPSSDRAAKLYRQAESQGDEKALEAFANSTLPGAGYETWSKLFDLYKQKAEAGDPTYMYKLATLNAEVIAKKLVVWPSMGKQYAKTINDFYDKWINKAGSLKYPEALLLLAGRIEMNDPEGASNYFVQAAENGSCRAYFLLAEYFAERDGGFREGGKALEWLKKAEAYLGCWSAEMDNLVQDWAFLLDEMPEGGTTQVPSVTNNPAAKPPGKQANGKSAGQSKSQRKAPPSKKTVKGQPTAQPTPATANPPNSVNPSPKIP